MQELQNAVAEAFSKVVASGAIEKAIHAELEKTVTGLMRDQLREYGDFGKKLKEHVTKSMDVNFSELDLPSYNHFILGLIRKQAEAALTGDIAKKLEEDMAGLLQGAPKEVTLEKLVDDFRDDHKEKYGEPRYGSFSLHIETSSVVSDYWHISLDPDDNKSDSRCKYKLSVTSEGKIYAMSIDGHDVKNSLFTPETYGFGRDLFRMFAAGTKVTIQPGTSEYDLSKSYGYDD